MKKREKMKLALVKPKRLFGKHDYKKALKGNVFGITLATGQQLLCHVSYRFTSRELVKLVRTRIGPYVRAAYPSQVNLRILFDGEPLLHANEAEAALDEFGILLSAGLASEFPDLNPQENVWPWLGSALRKQELTTESSAVFRARLTRLAAKYPSPKKLIASMPNRTAACLAKGGAMTKY